MEKAPDKIFLWTSPLIGVDYDPAWYNNSFEESDVAYIRKDALLEWAKNELESARQTDFDEFGRGEVITLESIIKKIESL